MSQTILEGLSALLNALFGAFFGSYFGYLLAQRTQVRAQRRDTNAAATKVLADYDVLLSRGRKPTDEFLISPRDRKPTDEFLVRVSLVDIEIADRFSETAYQVWRKAQTFFTDDGSLPQGKELSDFRVAAEEVRTALRRELSWRGPRS